MNPESNGMATDRLRKKYQDSIAIKREEIRALETKLEVISELEAESRTLELPLKQNQFVGLGLTDAVLAVINQGKSAMSASDIRRSLESNGFSTQSKNLSVVVNAAAKRLAKSGRVIVEEHEGKRRFKPNKPKE
jgi:hypothetical protein